MRTVTVCVRSNRVHVVEEKERKRSDPMEEQRRRRWTAETRLSKCPIPLVVKQATTWNLFCFTFSQTLSRHLLLFDLLSLPPRRLPLVVGVVFQFDQHFLNPPATEPTEQKKEGSKKEKEKRKNERQHKGNPNDFSVCVCWRNLGTVVVVLKHVDLPFFSPSSLHHSHKHRLPPSQHHIPSFSSFLQAQATVVPRPQPRPRTEKIDQRPSVL